ncbi:primosomal protein N' [Leptolyngbya sp. NIES-2104]|uniref:primosomal protein N' n=1 Tax=Leptolyngbya sp. NIES-2104 TaxID=1552121 RepID=UPI0006ECA3E4|nr:primosomal protein N' [Leptolyngbya sp. NIES-2104]GAP96240.1 helicase PriA essential for oriC/DnaA-independent DNA replication [Leptolyngbya sp. NIES-2104]
MSELQSVAESRTEYRTDPMWIEVLVDCPGAQGVFTYAVPSGTRVVPGDILSVPFGVQQVGGIAVRSLTEPPDLEHIRSIDSIVSAGFFPASYWALLDRVARYYQTSLMQVVRVALPPGLLARSQRRIRLIDSAANEIFLNPAAQQILKLLQSSKTKDYSWQFIQRQVKGAHRGLQDLLRFNWVESYLEPPATIRPQLRQAVILVSMQGELRGRQREILEVLKRNGGEMWLTDLLQQCRTTSPTVKRLQEEGCVILQGREVLRSEHGPEVEIDAAKSLTPDQAQVLEQIHAVSGFDKILLHGVTGSGKTEVYLQAIAPILEQGQSALVLVPEIGLTPQLTDRFRARFGDRVCVYHSALSDGERFDTWRQMLAGSPQVVIGTRSAIFAPLPNLGLIVLDEEHDSSFKQDQPAPCYHARSVAQWRAELEDCPLILGSATPSLESWLERSTYLSLPKRILDRPLPRIDVIDMRKELHDRNRSIFSRSLQAELKKLKGNNQKGLLFIHRRGHSTFVSCRSCGYVMDCPNCDVSLSYHHIHENAQPLLRCHYCNHTQLQPQQCPSCSSTYFKNFGSGTQRVVQELSQLFPELKTIRFDSDTTRAKGAHRALLSQFAQGDADLLVGTQMLTKGIDLPQVTLVGIISADGLLNLADFRASERAFQTLVQVAGRAGRGTEPGRVILQTYAPENPVIQAVKQQQYEPFVEKELEQRSILTYPPYGRLVLLRFSGLNPQTVQTTAETIADLLQSDENYQVLGPAPATILRIAQRYRWQILLKLNEDRSPDLTELRSHCPSTVSLTIDVDPMNLM